MCTSFDLPSWKSHNLNARVAYPTSATPSSVVFFLVLLCSSETLISRALNQPEFHDYRRTSPVQRHSVALSLSPTTKPIPSATQCHFNEMVINATSLLHVVPLQFDATIVFGCTFPTHPLVLPPFLHLSWAHTHTHRHMCLCVHCHLNVEHKICKWIHLRCAYEHICSASVAGWMLGVVSAVGSQQHLVAVSLCLSFRQLAVVAWDEEMDAVCAAVSWLLHLKTKKWNRGKKNDIRHEKEMTKCKEGKSWEITPDFARKCQT